MKRCTYPRGKSEEKRTVNNIIATFKQPFDPNSLDIGKGSGPSNCHSNPNWLYKAQHTTWLFNKLCKKSKIVYFEKQTKPYLEQKQMGKGDKLYDSNTQVW